MFTNRCMWYVCEVTYIHTCVYVCAYALHTSVCICVGVMQGRHAQGATIRCVLVNNIKERGDHPPAAACLPGHAVPAEHLPPAAACPNSAQCIQPFRPCILKIKINNNKKQHIRTITACVSLWMHNKCSKRSHICI